MANRESSFHDNGDGTATIAGNAASGTGGVYDSTLTAHNGVGADAVQSFALTVNEAPSITSPTSSTFTTSTASSFDFTTGGWPLPSFSVTGTLPSGVSFHDNGDGTGTLSGTPGADTGGTYTLTVTVSNLVTTATETFALTIDQPTAIDTASSTSFVVGQHASFTVSTTGFPLSSLTLTGALPTGLAFHDNGDGTGTLSGTPAAGTSGEYNLAVKAHNGVGTDSTQNFTLTVDQVPACTSEDAVTFTAGRAGAFEISCFGYPSARYLGNGSFARRSCVP